MLVFVVCLGCLTGQPASALRVLQMNLCDSGIAGCYTGRAVAEAAAVIRARSPDIVTLNEVCRDDVTLLADRRYVGFFEAAGDRRTGGATLCRNGQPYGIGLLVHSGHGVDSGTYPTQDLRDPEERAWLCVHMDGFEVCTTHLASTSASVAAAQCAYLLRTVRPRVLAGDLNLGDVRGCLPAGYAHRGDGGVQQVVAAGFRMTGGVLVDMDGTTDHPGLLVTLD